MGVDVCELPSGGRRIKWGNAKHLDRTPNFHPSLPYTFWGECEPAEPRARAAASCAGTELGLQCPHLGVVPALCPLRGLGRSPGWALVIAAAVLQSIVGPGCPPQLCEKRKEYKN